MKRVAIVWVLVYVMICALLNLTMTDAVEGSLTRPTALSTYSDENETATKDHAENRIAIIDTSYGEIKIELFERRAPITTSNFINLSKSFFYDGILFHRVIDDFVIQTGDPNTKDENPYNDGSGGSQDTIPLEIHSELTHLDGAVGMARSTEPDSASSQFYICDGPQHGLDGDYAVFGLVFEGIEVVRQIAQVDTWGNKRPILKDHPIDDVVMYSVFITENTTEYKYHPPEEDDWLPLDSWETPGFDVAILVCGLAIIMLIVGKRQYLSKRKN